MADHGLSPSQSTSKEPLSAPQATCSANNCSRAGIFKCSRCRQIYYCSKECQKADWSSRHKASYRDPSEDEIANCFLIRTGPKPTSEAMIAPLISPLHLANFGTEHAEADELRQRLGWTGYVGRVAEVYDHKGTDTWYYFGYGQGKDQRAGYDELTDGPKYNGLVSMLTGDHVYGDVAMIRSLAGTKGEDPGPFKKGDLCATARWYLKGKVSPKKIYAEREKSRFSRTYGLEDMLRNVPAIKM